MAENRTDSYHAPQPFILRNMQEICYVMGVSRNRVLDWIEAGAPIAVESEKGDSSGRTRYSADAAALQAWRVKAWREAK